MASYNQYSQYSSNPYEEGQQQGGYGSSNPYGNDGGNPYGGSYGQVSIMRYIPSTTLQALPRSTGDNHNAVATLLLLWRTFVVAAC